MTQKLGPYVAGCALMCCLGGCGDGKNVNLNDGGSAGAAGHEGGSAGNGGAAGEAGSGGVGGVPQHCGTEQPIQLLSLEPRSERIRVQRLDDRLIYDVRDGTIRSTDLCGQGLSETPTALELYQPKVIGSLLVASSATVDDLADVYRIDPTGSLEPELMFEQVQYRTVAASGPGVLVLGEPAAESPTGLAPPAPLWLHTEQDGAIEIAAGVRKFDVLPDGQRALLLTETFRLELLDLASRGSESLATQVVRFLAAPTGTMVGYQIAAGSIYVLDLAARVPIYWTDSYTPLMPPYDEMVWTADGRHVYLVTDMLQVWDVFDAEAGVAVSLPAPGAFHVMHGEWADDTGEPFASSALSDGSIWVSASVGETPLSHRLYPATGELELLLPVEATSPNWFGRIDDRVFAIERVDGYAHEGALWLSEGQGGHEVTDAFGITHAFGELGQAVSVLAVAESPRAGELWRLDLESGASQRLDDEVYSDYSTTAFEGFVTYTVANADRFGVWAAPVR